MAAAEEVPDQSGAVRPDTAGEVCGLEPCGEGYLQASPCVGYVRVLEPDSGCEALQYQGAQLVGEWQFAPQRLPVESAQFQCDGDGLACQRELQAKNLGSEEVFSNLNVLAGPACVRGDEDIDECLRIWRITLARRRDGDIG
jgi:hypothetical protein